ncbi:MAG: ATP-binding cassette domain-containing protein [Pseudomonadota bacterium]
MSRAPLLQLKDVSLSFGGDPLIDAASLIVHPGDRIALVGRNGSGKSTLLKIIAGLIEPDSGTRALAPDARVGLLEQDPDMSGFETLGAFAGTGMSESDLYHVEKAAEGLDFDPQRPVDTASGGERRRAALARLLAGHPTLMLLDEPTNHLDIAAIDWLESQLQARRAGFVLISHDRAFLRRLSRATVWIDRGTVRRQDKGFEAFETWRDTVWEEEDAARHKMDRRIASESRWAVEGISARRKRNQGRLRALQALRAERMAQTRRQGTAALSLDSGQRTGRKVIEARGLGLSFGSMPVIRDFTLTIERRDRVAFVGPNGVGKTTLLNLLMKTQRPDSGDVRHGTSLVPAVFDQSRAALDPDQTLWGALTDAPGLRVSGQSDQVMVRGAPRHVVGYLKDYLFDETQARAPVKALSGGERARLLLARLMAQESNLLVLDEPTNDLDIETLDVLQDVLDGYDGTVLLVSHDRDFIDRVATTTVVLEGQGRATVYAGGWTDANAQAGGSVWSGSVPAVKPEPTGGRPVPAPRDTAGSGRTPASSTKLTFRDQHRLKTLPDDIARLEAEIARLETLMSDPELYNREPAKFSKASVALAERQTRLSEAEEEWLVLAERAEAAGQ